MNILRGLKWLGIIWITGALFPFSVIPWIVWFFSKYGKGIEKKMDDTFSK